MLLPDEMRWPVLCCVMLIQLRSSDIFRPAPPVMAVVLNEHLTEFIRCSEIKPERYQVVLLDFMSLCKLVLPVPSSCTAASCLPSMFVWLVGCAGCESD